MSRIRNNDTTPELIVRKYLFAKGYRYRLQVNNLPGKLDLVLPKYKTVIFIHGCLWQSNQNCKYFVIPKTRSELWLNKPATNKRNDESVELRLISMGWNIIIIWICELKKMALENTLENLNIKFKAIL